MSLISYSSFCLLLCVIFGCCAWADPELESEFRDPGFYKSKAVSELPHPVDMMGYANSTQMIDQLKAVGFGGVLFSLSQVNAATWEVLEKVTEHARQQDLAIGLRDLPLYSDCTNNPCLQRITWSACPLVVKPGESTNLYPVVISDDPATYNLAKLAIPVSDDPIQLQQIVRLDKTSYLPPGNWQVIQFGSSRSEPAMVDFFDGKVLMRHINTALAECQKNLPNTYGNKFMWYQFSLPDQLQLVWRSEIAAEFVKRCGVSLERYFPVLAGFTLTSADVTAGMKQQLAQIYRDLWREKIGKWVDELVHEAGLEAGIKIGDAWLDPEEVGCFFARPVLSFTQDSGERGINQRAAGGARLRGRRTIVGYLSVADVPPHDSDMILPVIWKHAVDRLFEDGANQIWLAMDQGMELEAQQQQQVAMLCSYLHRCQTVLQRGRPVSDFLVLGETSSSVLSNYGHDNVNLRMLEHAMIRSGRICFNSERNYDRLVITSGIIKREGVLDTLHKLVQQGAKIWLVSGQGLGEPLSGELAQRVSAAGLVQIDAARVPLTPGLRWQSDTPELQIRYWQRHSDEHEIYFLTNSSDMAGSVVCIFRDTGKGTPMRWFPVTGLQGVVEGSVLLSDGSVQATLFMEPYDSCFVVFRR